MLNNEKSCCVCANVHHWWSTIFRLNMPYITHDDVIKWKHIPRYWPFVRGIHRSPVHSRTKASDAELWYFFICAWINGWVNNGEAGDLRHHRAHYDVTVMLCQNMMISLHGHAFHITCCFCGEAIGYWWFASTKGRDCRDGFFFVILNKFCNQTVERPVWNDETSQ